MNKKHEVIVPHYMSPDEFDRRGAQRRMEQRTRRQGLSPRTVLAVGLASLVAGGVLGEPAYKGAKHIGHDIEHVGGEIAGVFTEYPRVNQVKKLDEQHVIDRIEHANHHNHRSEP